MATAPILSLHAQENHQTLQVNPPTELCLRGSLSVPGDKSISHRALMLGAMATGQTTIQGLLLGEDPRRTAACFTAMGAKISDLNSELVTVQGIGLGNLQEPLDILDAGNSGTTIRLMMGLLAGHAGKFFAVTGDNSLRSRPMSRVIKPLSLMGAQIWGKQDNSRAPLAVRGQQLKPIHYQSPIASAQVKSAVLLAGLLADGQTTVTEPALSRDHSERMLRAFGAEVIVDVATHSATITGWPKLQGQPVIVPGDISSAAFWLVAAAIIPNSELLLTNVGVNPTRTGILTALALMNADVILLNEREVAGEPVADIRVRSSQLQACEIGGDLIPRLVDEIPILAVAALFAQGTTIIKDAAELRVKESDRLAVMAAQLGKMGAIITELPDGLEIAGGQNLTGAELDSFTDHRIAMSLAIAALTAKGSSHIQRADAAAVSYPSFFESLRAVIN
jgi:3-phosphoshikimate 1-carboxyvinyltransferase